MRKPRSLKRRPWKSTARVLGAEHLDTLKSMKNLANVYNAQGKYMQAEALDSQTQEIERRVLGPEQSRHAEVHEQSGLSSISIEGKYAQAEALYTQTLEIERRVLGPEHPDTLKSMNNLAASMSAEGKYAQSEALISQTLEIGRRVLGPEHPVTLAMHEQSGRRVQR